MNHYQDIRLLPDAEANLGFLWHKVFGQLHIMLAEHQTPQGGSDVGLYFPDYGQSKFPLGSRLRLIGPQPVLQGLALPTWLQRLQDYVHIKSPQPVPEGVSQGVVCQRQEQKSQHRRLQQVPRRAKVLAKRHGVTEAEMQQQLTQAILSQKEQCTLPYIDCKSLSRGGHFRLYIRQQTQEGFQANSQQTFNCYGLSNGQQALPWF